MSQAENIETTGRMPRSLIWAMLVICAAPFCLNLVGVDFSSSKPGFPWADAPTMAPHEKIDAMFYTLSGSFTHTLLEWTAFLTAIFTLFLAFLHFSIKRDITTPIIGVALFCAGVMDAFHTLAADRLIESVADNRNLIPFTWAISRIFMASREKAEEERAVLHKQLVETSRRVGMADVATGVLHNVGNVLNSVNVAAGVVADTVRRSSVDKISRTAGMIQEHLHDVGNYLTQDPKGQQIPEYLNKLGHQLTQDQEVVLGELKELVKNIEHIKEIISVQQTVAKSSSMEEPVVLAELMAQALSVHQTSLDKFHIEVTRDFMAVPEIVVDKHQVLQVLVNLISNSKQAMKNVSDRPRVLTVRIMEFEEKDKEWVKLEVSDTGVGISHENMTRVFSQGFTTKQDGHGFGLHSGSLSAKIMGGSLTVHSDGEHQGATFTLTLPAKRREVGVAKKSRESLVVVAGEE